MSDIEIKETENGQYRYWIIERSDGIFQVVYERWFDERQSDYTLSSWGGFDNMLHLVDTYKRAVELGENYLKIQDGANIKNKS